MALAPPRLDALAQLEDDLRRLDAVLVAAVARQRAEGRWRGDDDLRGIYTSPELAAAVLAGRAGGELDGREAGGHPHGVDLPRADADRADCDSGPLTRIVARFGLDDFERFALLLALAPEVDARYRTVLGYLNDDVGQSAPTIALALELFAGAGPRSAPLRRAFGCEAPLVRYRLVRMREPAGGASLPRRGLEVDDWVVACALGDEASRDEVAAHCELEVEPTDDAHAGRLPIAADRRAARDAAHVAGVPLAVVAADRRAGRDASLAADGTQLVVDLAAAAASVGAVEALALAARRARMHGAALSLVAADVRHDDELLALVTALAADGLTIAVVATPNEADALPEAWPRRPVAAVSRARRRERWASGLATARVTAEVAALDAVAASHPIALDRIDAAVTRLATERSPRPRGAAELQAAARSVARHRLGGLARRVPPGRCWDDLVLPAPTLLQLRQIAASIADRPRVLDDWGFGARAGGRGMHLLFSGVSGTGKTLAASVIAEEAGYALYGVDLARVVDKYIGETEKHLDRVFEEALAAGAVLLFDEADALFGRRAEVNDARDRYANVEIAYLLQRLEAHEGVTILATNLGHHLDPAFARRLHHRVDFAMPGAALRERLWRATLPAAAPLDADLDLALVAERFELAGGSIRGAALGAAYRAAAGGRPIAMDDVVRAVARELEKAGRPATRAEFRELYGALSRDA